MPSRQGPGLANLPRGRARVIVGWNSARPPRPGYRLRVGLMGGSFNPAHEGHLHLSLEALRTLELDQVWWLVSPQNPLKPRSGMAPIEARVARAEAIATHPRIKVRRLEERLHTRYSADTLNRLSTWEGNKFVWLLGADNLIQMPHWRRWRTIFETCPIAVFARSDYFYDAVGGKVARSFASARIPESAAARLIDCAPPAWVYIMMRTHPASSTAIRGEIPAGAWWCHAASESS